MSDPIELSVEQLNQMFIEAQPFYNPVIATRAKKYNKIWGKLISRGNFEYGQGYVKSKFTFHSGTANQSSGRLWQAMRAPSAPNPQTGDPGHTGCRYEASVINYGIEQKQYTVYETYRRTEDICLTDILFKWQAQQHIAAFMSSFADITLGEWENFTREAYLTFCEKVFAIEGMPSFTAAMGADTIDVSSVDVQSIGVLSQGLLDRMYQYLYREAAMGALGMKNTMPTFGVMSSAETLHSLIDDDDTRRTDMRYAKTDFLLEGIGMVDEYKGWLHMQDPQTIRYELSADGTSLVRVWPFNERDTTMGKKTIVNQRYIDAPFEISYVIVKDVFKELVPPSNPSFGSAKFDPVANYGQFFWKNIEDRETNPLGEIGFWLARFRCAPEPGDNSDRAFAILHRRNVGARIVLPDTCDTSPQSNSVTINTTVDVSGEDAYANLVVVLAECIACNIGDVVTVNGDTLARVSNYLGGTSYEIVFATEADWKTTVEAGAMTIQCGDQIS